MSLPRILHVMSDCRESLNRGKVRFACSPRAGTWDQEVSSQHQRPLGDLLGRNGLLNAICNLIPYRFEQTQRRHTQKYQATHTTILWTDKTKGLTQTVQRYKGGSSSKPPKTLVFPQNSTVQRSTEPCRGDATNNGPVYPDPYTAVEIKNVVSVSMTHKLHTPSTE